MRGSDFVSDSVDLLFYYLHRINLKRGKSYIDSPEWLKNKKATINPINKKDNTCFKYALTAALNHKQRISNLKPFMGQLWMEKYWFSGNFKRLENFEQDNKTIALNILFVPYNTKQITRSYISKNNY